MAPTTWSPPLSSATLTITDTPTRDDLQTWWRIRHADPESILAFTDDAPHDFLALCTCLTTDAYVFYLAHNLSGDIIGAMWLHDLVLNDQGMPRAGWLGTYVLPSHRGVRTTQAMWTLVREALKERGVHSVYIASHVANARAHCVAQTHLGFYPVGIFPAFARFGGQRAACLILSMRYEDMAESWTFAHARACLYGPVSPLSAMYCLVSAMYCLTRSRACNVVDLPFIAATSHAIQSGENGTMAEDRVQNFAA